jgi:hypothetical protein
MEREEPAAAGDDLEAALACTGLSPGRARVCASCPYVGPHARDGTSRRHRRAPALSTRLVSDSLAPSAKSASPKIGRTTFVTSKVTEAARTSSALGEPGAALHERRRALVAGPPLS